MPRISYFYGISIYMYYGDHPPAHVHAIYGEHEATVAVDTAEILQGRLPPRARSFVVEWATIHRGELQRNWERAWAAQPLEQIAPLE